MNHSSSPIDIAYLKRNNKNREEVPFIIYHHTSNDTTHSDAQLVVRPTQRVQGESMLTHLLRKEITNQERLMMQKSNAKILPQTKDKKDSNNDNRNVEMQKQRLWVRKCPMIPYEISLIDFW